MKSANLKLLTFAVLIIAIIFVGLFCYSKKTTHPIFSNKEISTNTKKIIDTSSWIKYTNKQLEFSIKIPPEVPTLYRCPDNEQTGNTPLNVFEDSQNGSVYITPTYYYDTNWNQPEQRFIGECNKITYSLESLKKEGARPFLGWKIVINNPKNDTEITNFIKQNFGSTCIIESKNLQSDGNYKITIKGKNVGQNLMDTDCLTNFQYEILYSPTKNKLMSVIIGQECTFGTDPSIASSYQCYDEEIIKSFKFE